MLRAVGTNPTDADVALLTAEARGSPSRLYLQVSRDPLVRRPPHGKLEPRAQADPDGQGLIDFETFRQIAWQSFQLPVSPPPSAAGRFDVAFWRRQPVTLFPSRRLQSQRPDTVMKAFKMFESGLKEDRGLVPVELARSIARPLLRARHSVESRLRR